MLDAGTQQNDEEFAVQLQFRVAVCLCNETILRQVFFLLSIFLFILEIHFIQYSRFIHLIRSDSKRHLLGQNLGFSEKGFSKNFLWRFRMVLLDWVEMLIYL